MRQQASSCVVPLVSPNMDKQAANRLLDFPAFVMHIQFPSTGFLANTQLNPYVRPSMHPAPISLFEPIPSKPSGIEGSPRSPLLGCEEALESWSTAAGSTRSEADTQPSNSTSSFRRFPTKPPLPPLPCSGDGASSIDAARMPGPRILVRKVPSAAVPSANTSTLRPDGTSPTSAEALSHSARTLAFFPTAATHPTFSTKFAAAAAAAPAAGECSNVGGVPNKAASSPSSAPAVDTASGGGGRPGDMSPSSAVGRRGVWEDTELEKLRLKREERGGVAEAARDTLLLFPPLPRWACGVVLLAALTLRDVGRGGVAEAARGEDKEGE
mmetsp:Transcript_19165/g.39468  ORF Transcript_19165/g.39468 Transcript_19165/m.39468 type:complete len:326 (-) Transcript_19165:1981-2958(-)